MKKKIGLISSLLFLVLFLVSCAGSPQKEFTDFFSEKNVKNLNAGDMQFSIKDIELEAATDELQSNPMVNMIKTQLKSVKMSGSYLVDAKNKQAFQTTMKLDMMGLEMPVEVIGNISPKKDPELYMSIDFFSSLYEFAQAFGGSTATIPEEFSTYKGKYIDIIKMQELDTNKTETDFSEKKSKLSQEFFQACKKEVATYINKIDKKTFEKKETTITHTFTKKEITDILNLIQKVAKSDKKFAAFENEKAAESELFKNIKDMSIKVKLDTKLKKITSTISLSPNEATGNSLKKIVIGANITLKTSKESVKMPSKETILSEEETNKLFQSTDTTSLGAPATTVPDAEFQQMKKTLVDTKGQVDAEKITEFLTQIKPQLTEAQFKELEEALK